MEITYVDCSLLKFLKWAKFPGVLVLQFASCHVKFSSEFKKQRMVKMEIFAKK